MFRTTQCSWMLQISVALLTSYSAVIADDETADQGRAAVAADLASAPSMGEWKQWRGPARANQSPETGLLSQWPEGGPPLVWRVEGLGDGIASVSIADGQIFTMTYANDLEFVVALDQATGSFRWAAPVGPAVHESRLMRWLTQRSPTLDGNRLYAVTAFGSLVCLNTQDGDVRWSKSYTKDLRGQPAWWGFCDHPLVDGDQLICTPGGSEAAIVALNKYTGDLIWQTAIPSPRSQSGHFAAPVIMQVGGIRQYVGLLQAGLVGVAAEDGQLLWRYDRINERYADDPQNALTPLVHGDRLFCVGSRGTVLALLTLIADDDNGISVREEYVRSCHINHFQDNAVLVDERVFISGLQGRRHRSLTCLELRSGEPLWEHFETERRRDGHFFATTYADGHLYVRSDTVTLVDTSSDEYREKGRFPIPDHQPAIGATTPVIAGGHLYIRDGDRLFAYDIRQHGLEIATGRQPRLVTLHLPEEPTRVNETGGRHTSQSSVFVATPPDVVDKMLELAKVKQSDHVYDLGSGDGRIVIAAARQYGCRATGYESDPRLVAIARAAAHVQGLDDLVSIQQEDLYHVDLSEADVIAVYLLPKQLEKLIPHFAKLPLGARVVSHYFAIPGITPQSKLDVRSDEDGAVHTIYVYQAPLGK
jgi:outer membrane protein assembly factor BamB